uniref:Uncharacterized protein n=1 Tax=Candidatus Kentrum sp. UNK TaxID=2126344 RepID=A0A451B5S3_9GAMM|nr:MAG: hypothetical protein BECKUNK1418G_GA0071005_12342 [Candidatus Kentron sp. UNK]VFK73577.1 MAG: hypothetical protein BECKUNK1418H_GA0071006_12232 [Candidatus Kentron sp. UNK]
MFKKTMISMILAMGIFFAGLSSAAVMPNEAQANMPAFALGKEVPIDMAMETRGEGKISRYIIDKVQDILKKAGIDAAIDWLADIDIPTTPLQVIWQALKPETAYAPGPDDFK